MFDKKCPKCNCIQSYTTKSNRDRSEKLGLICKKCSDLNKIKNSKNYIFCPKCNKKIVYKNNGDAASAFRKKTVCKKCASSSKIFKDKISKINSGINNPMSGKSYYDIWLVKYGKEEANIRLEQKRKNNSIASLGSKNPMYGKPSPNGSGNGWKGWYKGIFFRSLREMCFMIECDNRGIIYSNGEKIRIPYIDIKGSSRTYAPDFLINNKLIEIKPIRLHSSPNNLLKFKAAKKYCEDNNLDFWVIDIIVNTNLINDNIAEIKFQEKYKKGIEKWLRK